MKRIEPTCRTSCIRAINLKTADGVVDLSATNLRSTPESASERRPDSLRRPIPKGVVAPLGAERCINRPVEPEALLAEIEICLRARRQRTGSR